MISKSLTDSMNAIMRIKKTSDMTEKDNDSLRSLLDADNVLLCSPFVQEIYRCCLNTTEATINLIKEIPNDVDGQKLFMQRLPCRFDSPIRVNVKDPRIWRRFLVSSNKRSVPPELRIVAEEAHFACLGDVRMPTKYPVNEYGLQYDIERDKYFFVNGRPCSITGRFASYNGNWSLFRKDSVACVIDVLHFTERIIDPAPIQCYVDSNTTTHKEITITDTTVIMTPKK
jgi:hypothetical protein